MPTLHELLYRPTHCAWLVISLGRELIFFYWLFQFLCVMTSHPLGNFIPSIRSLRLRFQYLFINTYYILFTTNIWFALLLANFLLMFDQMTQMLFLLIYYYFSYFIYSMIYVLLNVYLALPIFFVLSIGTVLALTHISFNLYKLQLKYIYVYNIFNNKMSFHFKTYVSLLYFKLFSCVFLYNILSPLFYYSICFARIRNKDVFEDVYVILPNYTLSVVRTLKRCFLNADFLFLFKWIF